MLSLLDLDGIPRGMGSGSCNTGRTELPDLGMDIGAIQESFAIHTISAQTQPNLVATGDDWNVVSAAEKTQGLASQEYLNLPSITQLSGNMEKTIDLTAVRRN